MPEIPGVTMRPIRSYVLRGGRLTKAQNHALQHYAPEYCVTTAMLPRLDTLFPRRQPITLEIGFGNGGALAKLAMVRQDCNFLGIEVYPPGIGNLLKLIKQHKLTNLRVVHADAAVAISQFPPESLSQALILFPDPWHKRKHHKRRLLDSSFLSALAQRMCVDATLYIATDCADYARAIQHTVETGSLFRRASFVHPDNRPVADNISDTRFAKRAKRNGISIHCLLYNRL